MKKLLSCIVMLSAFCLSGMIMANNQSPPVSMLESLANEMIASLKSHQANLKNNSTLTYTLVEKIVIPHADLTEMSKRVLPPSIWQKATNEQRAQFENEFTHLLIRTYAGALADYTNQTVTFFPLRQNPSNSTRVTVNSQIARSDGPSIAMNYSLILKDSEWKIYDITVEGISLLQSFQEQFREKLSQGTMASLLAFLKQRSLEQSSQS